jgi:hypothetical protein
METEEQDIDLLKLARALQSVVQASRLLDNRLDTIEERLDRLERRSKVKLVSTN